ncbi:alpha-N-arabinofuranosidase [Silvibacterium bohemicum]|uniref:non-reducing end alpha-L-arabinofuranosidase n=1 Tax=Silvibacterium bohemicum TaxID=1577686 RepID=A0A841K5S8_9BACT|nr:alpha-L-arabinofuranosidase C-terminal domain-containing protein [Silvibacterium bohemicum]MBB6145958.1 alpha-N-arabinofuranosidase [Silvibacterium bohemicum]
MKIIKFPAVFRNCLLLLLPIVPAAAQDQAHLSIDAAKSGAKIDRNLFGQFAENLGRGLYGGIWVGPDSSIPNTRGIRNDVVGALRELKVPDVRWPGGCFADQYHWRNGIGPADKRPATVNSAWGDVVDSNAFGTDEFMDFVHQIGSNAYVSLNLGSGTPQEAAEWVEYMTAAEPTALAKERAANGHPAPYKIAMLGLGNESWDCGGAMSPDYYVSLMKIYSRFVPNMNPAQRDKDQMLRIAVGPGTPTTEWTEAVMKAWQHHTWSWDINGLSLHWYTVPTGWPPSAPSINFGVEDYAKTIKSTLFMDEFLRKQEAVMDKYDPEKKVALVVDEWGEWFAPLPGTNKSFLEQQNSMRDAVLAALNLNIFARHADRVRMANIAQMINVLQAMILTDREKMVLTPTYYIYKMYVPFQDATFVPVAFDAGTYVHGDVTLPRLDAIAARDATGKLWLALTNLDPEKPLQIEADINGMKTAAASGETLTAPAVDSINTFDSPRTVVPKPAAVKTRDGKLTVTLDPKSVTVISITP